MLLEIRRSVYIYIILSPEQAINPTFRSVVRNSLRDRVSLITINKLYLVSS